MIRKRGNSYEVRVYDPSAGKKVSVGSRGTAREARDLERRKASEFRRRGSRGGTSVAVFIDRWLRERKPAWRDTTLAHNAERTRAFVRDFGDRPIATLTRDELAAWAYDHPSNTPAVRAALSYASALGLIPDNPAAGLGVDRRPRRQLAPDWLTREDVEFLAATAREFRGEYGQHFGALVLFAAYTGLRPGEQFALRPRDVDLTRGRVHVREQRRANGTLGPTKNGLARTVVLPPPAAEALRVMPRHSDEWLFTTVTGKPFRIGSHRPYWVEVAAAAGKPGMDYYELRHFCATYLLEHGVSSEDVATQLGHTDGGQLVRRVYGHPNEERALERVEAIWVASEGGKTRN